MALCILKQSRRPNTATLSQYFAAYEIAIPAHATNHDVVGYCTYDGTRPVTLISAAPHAHRLARHRKFALTKRSGRTGDEMYFNFALFYPMGAMSCATAAR